jgi:hypothetical protein
MQRTYVRLLLLFCALGLLLGAALNIAVDPYGMYRWIDFGGFNRLKPKAGLSSRIVKPYRVLEIRPKTLLLGNSRVEIAFDPESSQWPAAQHPVYNMALPGTGVAAALRSLQHANTNSEVALVFMGVDFFDFLSGEQPTTSKPQSSPEPSEFERRMLVNPDGTRNDRRWLQVLRDHLSVAFSLNTLADSLYTIAAQWLPDQNDLTALGFNPLHEYRRIVRVDGHDVLFRQVETEYLRNHMHENLVLYDPGTNSSRALDELRELVALSRASNIRLVLYVPPYHARMLENHRLIGIWPLFEEWKRALVRVVEDARALPGSGTVELWDFSGYTEYTSERVPGPSEKGRQMRWYWEDGHYKRELGEEVLARVMGGKGVDASQALAFGVKLDAQNVDGHLAAIQLDRQKYAETHRDEITALEELAQSLRVRTQGKDNMR